MYIIDDTYFIKELYVPNLNEMDSDTLTTLETAVDRYVRQFLRDALGNVLFTELDSHITDGVLDAGAPQKWLDLVNGVDGWKGLAFTEGTYKGSILAKYVYYHWLKDAVSNMTGTGEKVITATDALAVNSTQRLTNVWNDFVEDNQGIFVLNRWTYGYDHFYLNEYYCHDTNYSLIRFLNDKSEDYPDANKKVYEIKNQLGL